VGERRPSGGRAKTSSSRGRKTVYFFGDRRAAGNAKQRNLLGGKGANLAEMTRLGVPVPPGFTIATSVATEFSRAGGRLPQTVIAQARRALTRVEKIAGARFGDAENPLLVSVLRCARLDARHRWTRC
jgi:pyruvate,orthophosphate dikinase